MNLKYEFSSNNLHYSYTIQQTDEEFDHTIDILLRAFNHVEVYDCDTSDLIYLLRIAESKFHRHLWEDEALNLLQWEI